MNFFKHHIGDYAAATGHLSFVEDAAYHRLLRIYYRDERPLPADTRAVMRLAGARAEDERAAVEIVLNEFFALADDGWHSKRGDEEIAKAQAQAETNRRIADEREAAKRARIVKRTALDPVNESLDESLPVREPSQTPDTRHQNPDKSEKHEHPDGCSSPDDAGDSSDDVSKAPRCPVKQIVVAYHAILPNLPPVNELPDEAERMLRARWRSKAERQTVEWWREFFAYVGKCPFLIGERTDFQADFIWLVRPRNFAKVLNGNYETRAA